MTSLDLYKFIIDHGIEWKYQDNEGEEDVMILISNNYLNVFHKILTPSIFDDGIECIMKDGYFAFWMKDICDYYGIDLIEVFEK